MKTANVSVALRDFYSKAVMSEAGVKISVIVINNLHYADDTNLIVTSESYLKNIQKVNESSQKASLY